MGQYNHDQARVDAQAKRMKSLEERSVCAFCPEHIASETTSKIETETHSWMVKDNDYPYEHTKYHLLVIPKLHVKSISDLAPEAMEEFLPLIAQVEKKYGLTSYAIAMRSGDMHRNGGTVEHLHAHIIVGDTDNPDHETVRFKVSSRPKK